MSINAYLQMGNTVMFAANSVSPSGVQVTACGNVPSAMGVRIFNEDNQNTVWVAYSDAAAGAKAAATLPNTTTPSTAFPVPPLAVEMIRVNFPTPQLFFSGITRVAVAANIHVTPGDGM